MQSLSTRKICWLHSQFITCRKLWKHKFVFLICLGKGPTNLWFKSYLCCIGIYLNLMQFFNQWEWITESTWIPNCIRNFVFLLRVHIILSKKNVSWFIIIAFYLLLILTFFVYFVAVAACCCCWIKCQPLLNFIVNWKSVRTCLQALVGYMFIVNNLFLEN